MPQVSQHTALEDGAASGWSVRADNPGKHARRNASQSSPGVPRRGLGPVRPRPRAGPGALRAAAWLSGPDAAHVVSGSRGGGGGIGRCVARCWLPAGAQRPAGRHLREPGSVTSGQAGLALARLPRQEVPSCRQCLSLSQEVL